MCKGDRDCEESAEVVDVDVVAEAVSHPDSSSVDQGECGGSGGVSRDGVYVYGKETDEDI